MNSRGFFLQKTDHDAVWHPFDKPYSHNILLKKAKGVYYYDYNNKKYIDAVSSWWVNIHGHGNLKLKNATTKQFAKLDHVLFAGFTHEPAIRLSAALLTLTHHHFGKVFLSDNGSTSVEVALKLALLHLTKQQHKKIAILAFENAYHGDTFGAMALGGSSIFHSAFRDLLFDVVYLPLPTTENKNAICKQINELQNHNDAVIFIYEPLIQGAGGMNIYHKENLIPVLHELRKHESVLIADEVMTGFYRTGTFTASEKIYTTHPTLVPDMICLSKGITGGILPLGATLIATHMVDTLKAEKFYHGHSYTGNAISCALACENLRLFTQKTLENIARIAQQHLDFVHVLKKNTSVKNVAVCGTILRMELNVGTQTHYEHEIREKIYAFFIAKGILLRPLGNVIYILPPYCIKPTELQKIYSAILAFVEQ